MESLLQDLRFGFRMLRKNPSFTAVAVITLALGIGANTAIFSLVQGILLRSLPYRQPDRLVSITGSYPRGAFAAMREQIRSAEVAAYAEGHEFNLTGSGEPVRLKATLVSSELFSVLGVAPRLGRAFQPGEDLAGHGQVLVLSNALWQGRFGGDPNIVGRVISLDGVPREVVGVMPPEFRFPSSATDIWVPLEIDPRNVISYWASDFMPVIGRLHDGVSVEQASAEARLFQSHVRALFPWPMSKGWNADVSVLPLQTAMVQDTRSRLIILLAAVALVLLIACANVANLTLSRESARAREIAIRASLGAGRNRIVRQLLTESLVIAAAGGVLGFLLAGLGLSVLKSSLPADTPRLSEVIIDWPVLLFTAALAVATGIISGLAPALQSVRTEPAGRLHTGGRGSATSISRSLRAALVIGELSLAVVLVCGAGLLIRSLWALSHVDPGFLSEHVVTAHITPNESFCNDVPRCVGFYRSLTGKVQSLPGVNGAALISTLPLNGRVSKRSVDIENDRTPPGESLPLFWMNAVSSGYFQLMGIPVLRGRSFTEADSSGAAVAMVSESTARRWLGDDPLGKHLHLSGQDDWYTVVGVVPDLKAYDLARSIPDWMNGTLYLPYGPKSTMESGRVPSEMTLAVRTAASAPQMQDLIQRTVAALNADTPVTEVKTMPAVVSEAISGPRSVTLLFTSFAGLALVLGIVGIYGVISFFVGQRTREIGIRMALGARRRDVVNMVMEEGLILAVTGVGAGLGAAFVLTRFLQSLLFGVTATDPLSFSGVAILFALVALAACYIPARRASQVDPMIALRYE